MILFDTSLVIDTSLSSIKKRTLFSRLPLSEPTITYNQLINLHLAFFLQGATKISYLDIDFFWFFFKNFLKFPFFNLT
jgi:hypothetical protein